YVSSQSFHCSLKECSFIYSDTFNTISQSSYYKSRNMKAQTLLLQATLLLVFVACRQVHGMHKEVCDKPTLSKVSVKVVNCQERTVLLKQCAGTCLSEESYQGETCWCCKPVKRVQIPVDVLCTGGYVHTQMMEQHEECSCSRCFGQ
ncbi:hypothetical protein ACROYT_G035618, partial [Oculina patagonica]